MTRTAPLALVLLMAVPAVATAASVDDRQARQAERIEKGRENGSITWTEGLKLRAQQYDIKRTEAALKSDGYLSQSDRRKLDEMQDQAAKTIRAEKNDGWHRLWGLPRVGK